MGHSTEWPVGLLLDEAWLRARRVLVTEMERSGVWPDAAKQRVFLDVQRAKGNDIRDRVLLPALGPEASDWLVSPASFGAANQRFRSHTPLSLAFGHSISEVLQGTGGQIDRQAADAAALFNFGISMFDLLHDTLPDLAPSFGEMFGHDQLRALIGNPTAADRLAGVAGGATTPEVSLLLRTIAAVFEAIHRLTGRQAAKALKEVGSLLTLAYTAETASSGSSASADERVRVSRDKSVLPFCVIGAIGRLSGQCPDCGGELAETLGTIFWKVDDLADLVGDTRSHSLNSLLLRAGERDEDQPAAALAALLVGNGIEEAAANICAGLIAQRQMVERSSCDPALKLDRVAPSYVRMWIE